MLAREGRDRDRLTVAPTQPLLCERRPGRDSGGVALSVRLTNICLFSAMSVIVQIPLSDLLLDTENPRLEGKSSTQQETALELTAQQGEALVKMAADIVDHGLDPTTLPAVIATNDRRKRYEVLEGNRRILALRALETPPLVSPAPSAALNRRLTKLAAKYERDPISTVSCVLFDSEEEADHWRYLRHTGQNQGVGLVPWGAVEQDRFKERHAGKRSPARQVIEFVEKHGALSDTAKASKRKIITTVARLVETTYVREKLGLDLVQGDLVALYPADQLAKALTLMIEDLKTGKVTVPNLYHVGDRRKYVDSLPRASRPKASTRLNAPVMLDDLTAGTKTPRSVALKRRRTPRRPSRTTVIPKTAQFDVQPPRINQIYNELLSLNAEQFPNACSVLLRVFIELSVDHYISRRQLMNEKELRAENLAKRLRTASADLKSRGMIPDMLRAAIDQAAGSKMIGPSLVTLNQYVHNEYVLPKTADLYSTWDEFEPFLAKVWP